MNIPLTTLQHRMAKDVPLGKVDENTVRRLWWGALETLQEDLLAPMELSHGLWLASPLPALYEPRLLDRLQGWVWAPDQLEKLQFPNSGLFLPSRSQDISRANSLGTSDYVRLPLRAEDGYDPLLIILTPEVQVALALQGPPGQRNLLMRSDQATFRDLLEMLDLRLNSENREQAYELRKALSNLGQLKSNQDIDKAFWPLLSARLASIAPSLTLQTISDKKAHHQSDQESIGEITLLEAITHEVRTPLATIRTLIRSILRREDIPELIVNRLREIDAECSEQIDRFGLIFSAAELQRDKPSITNLASTDLGRMLEILHPAWKKQLVRRGIELHLDITPNLPDVLSDPERLELMLGGLIDRSTRGLKSGGTLFLELRPAGQKLKLKILRKYVTVDDHDGQVVDGNADLGPVLSWNPRTGSLQLTQAATQRLLASLGGKLAHRRDSGLTVFFPIADSKTNG